MSSPSATLAEDMISAIMCDILRKIILENTALPVTPGSD
jgi:hypothetical protein